MVFNNIFRRLKGIEQRRDGKSRQTTWCLPSKAIHRIEKQRDRREAPPWKGGTPLGAHGNHLLKEWFAASGYKLPRATRVARVCGFAFRFMARSPKAISQRKCKRKLSPAQFLFIEYCLNPRFGGLG